MKYVSLNLESLGEITVWWFLSLAVVPLIKGDQKNVRWPKVVKSYKKMADIKFGI